MSLHKRCFIVNEPKLFNKTWKSSIEIQLILSAVVKGRISTAIQLLENPATFITADKIDRFSGWDSINKPEVAVSATLGTTFEKQVKEWFPNAKIKIVESPALGHMEVISGRADVFVTSNIEGATLMEKFDNIKAIKVEKARSPALIAMLLPQADQVWINYVNNWIAIKKERGFFNTIAAKWKLN